MKYLIPLTIFALSLTGCGNALLSQKQMDEKIEELTLDGQKQLRPMLERACDQQFDSFVEHYTDSLLTVAGLEAEGN